MKEAVVTKSKLEKDFEALGLTKGQTITVHSSVKMVGWIVGGPDVIIRSILDVLTPSGTLMMLVSWEDNLYELVKWPEDWQEAYLAECPAYDRETSRADHRAMGILTEYLRTWPGAKRSDHPFSYAAVGAKAEYVTANHPLNYRDGEDSPLAKLCELEGKVLLLGPLFENVTLLHHSEHLANIPNKRIDRYKMPIHKDGKRVWVEMEEFDTTNGIVDWPDDYFETIVKGYISLNKASEGKVGNADSFFFDARDLRDYGIKWMEQNFK